MEKMTELTRIMYGNAMQIHTIDQAKEMLVTFGQFRGLSDVLKSFVGCDNPKKKIVDALVAFNPEKRRDSVNKKVGNWLNDSTNTLEKREIYHLCRALDFSLTQTDSMLKYISGEGIHWRDPEEIIWCYAIANRLHYPDICRLLDSSGAGAKGHGWEAEPAPGSFTEAVRDDVLPLLNQPEDALLDYLARCRHILGAYHNTAYELFMEYSQVLEGTAEPDKIEADGKVTSRYIVEHYLLRRVIPVSRRGEKNDKPGFSAVQRSIRMNWPDETTYSKMKSRELDVSRKVMMLLFLAMDDGEPDEQPEDAADTYDPFEDELYEEKPMTRDERFDMLQRRMNRMLTGCGFQQLDPRNPFDWIILFCMCTEDMIELDRRLEDTLKLMFPNGSENQNQTRTSDIL